jgi:hypothetical protein
VPVRVYPEFTSIAGIYSVGNGERQCPTTKLNFQLSALFLVWLG